MQLGTLHMFKLMTAASLPSSTSEAPSTASRCSHYMLTCWANHCRSLSQWSQNYAIFHCFAAAATSTAAASASSSSQTAAMRNSRVMQQISSGSNSQAEVGEFGG